MPSTLEEYVCALTDDEKIRIIEGHEYLKDQGAIGDEPIRQHTLAFLGQHGIPNHNIVMWMELLAHECHRYFSILYRSKM